MSHIVETDEPIKLPPELNAIAKDAIQSVKASVARAMTKDTLPRGKSIEKSFVNLWKSSEKSSRIKARRKIMSMNKNKQTRKKFFGKHADARSYNKKPLSGQKISISTTKNFKKIREKIENNPQHYAQKIAELNGFKVMKPKAKPLLKDGNKKRRTLTRAHTKLNFNLRRVYCKKVTRLNWKDDNIYMGGSAFGATGKQYKIKSWKVGDFNTNRAINCNKKMVSFDLNEGGDIWPKYYWMVLSMSEVDSGSVFEDSLKEFWEDYETEVKAAITTALMGVGVGVGVATGAASAVGTGAAAGTAAGSVAGPIGAAIGTVVGIIVAVIVDVLVNWLFTVFDDVLLGSKKYRMIIGDPYAKFKEGYRRSKEGQRNYEGADGHYITYAYWTLT